MRKEEKTEIIDSLVSLMQEYPNVYLANLESLNAEKTSQLRRECYTKNVKLVVIKNTLFAKALERVEGDFEELLPVLKGNTALMFSEVANVPAKILAGYKKDKSPSFKGAYVQQSVYVGAQNLSFLENIKSKEELLGEIVGLLQSPVQNVLSALQSGGNTIHGVLETLSKR